ncbi:uncharacterized protein LOC143264113 [Megachile rotundata]|uniref:uncharacterized protein LOC143264113 n=1 Tax=Megachile rotundata TaxID=143995 RepID=UPI003FD0752C
MAENTSHEMEIDAKDAEEKKKEDVKKEKENDRPPTDNLKKLLKKLLYGGRGRGRWRGRGRGRGRGGHGHGHATNRGNRSLNGGRGRWQTRGRRGRKSLNFINNYKFILQ